MINGGDIVQYRVISNPRVMEPELALKTPTHFIICRNGSGICSDRCHWIKIYHATDVQRTCRALAGGHHALCTRRCFLHVLYMGVLWFASIPALKADKPLLALVNGAIIGLMCYATYEFTNYATLKGWHWTMVLKDCLWGAFLTGTSAWLGVWAVKSRG